MYNMTISMKIMRTKERPRERTEFRMPGNIRSSSFFFAPFALLANLNFFIQIFTVLIRKIICLYMCLSGFKTGRNRKQL